MGKITLLDGAVGTSLWGLADKYGIKKDPVWTYNITHPELVTELGKAYAGVGCDIILANTFGANRQAVKRSSDYSVSDVVSSAIELTRDAIKGSGAKLAMAVGPLMQLMEPYGDLEEDEVEEIYDEMISAGAKKGFDCITIQTFIDLNMMRVAATVAKRYGVPVYCTMSFEKRGKTMMGNSVDDIIDELAPLGVDAVGLNCSLGPDLALPIVKEFAEKTDLPIMYKPNAGLPIMSSDGTTTSDYTPEDFAREVQPALEYVDFIGGCCGTDWTYVAKLKELL